jgi:hypothetical protein
MKEVIMNTKKKIINGLENPTNFLKENTSTKKVRNSKIKGKC